MTSDKREWRERMRQRLDEMLDELEKELPEEASLASIEQALLEQEQAARPVEEQLEGKMRLHRLIPTLLLVVIRNDSD